MICPKCHAEYFENNEKCGDCNLELIDACSIDIPIPDMQWVALKPIYSSTTADMITEILNNEEIPHYAKSDWASSALNTSGNSLIDNIVRIFIPKLYEKKAVRITPPLTISENEINQGCDIIIQCLKKIN